MCMFYFFCLEQLNQTTAELAVLCDCTQAQQSLMMALDEESDDQRSLQDLSCAHYFLLQMETKPFSSY